MEAMKVFIRISIFMLSIVGVEFLGAQRSYSAAECIKRDIKRQNREKWEKINHQYAFRYALKLGDKTRKDITLEDILSMHYYILRNIDDEHAGRLRQVNVRLVSAPSVKFPDYTRVPSVMNKFMHWLHTVTGDPVTIAIRAFCKLVLEIHPFSDGNGRTSRLFMNLLLMQAGYKPLHFHKKLNSHEYYDIYIPALNKVLFRQDYRDFEALIFSRLHKRTGGAVVEDCADQPAY